MSLDPALKRMARKAAAAALTNAGQELGRVLDETRDQDSAATKAHRFMQHKANLRKQAAARGLNPDEAVQVFRDHFDRHLPIAKESGEGRPQIEGT